MSAIKTLIGDMRKLREATTPKQWFVENSGLSVVDKDRKTICSFDSDDGFGAYRDWTGNAAFIAAAPTNQERLEKALEIAVEALEKIELSHYEDCVYWEEEDEEADCNCGSYKRRQTALAAIETALSGDEK